MYLNVSIQANIIQNHTLSKAFVDYKFNTHDGLKCVSTTPEDLKHTKKFGQNTETQSRCSLLPPAAVKNFGEAGHHYVLVLQTHHIWVCIYTICGKANTANSTTSNL